MKVEVGIEIKKTYNVERHLGSGAFADVYRVKHKFLGRQAMKIFKEENMSEEQIVNLLQEAMMLSKIGHPNVIRVFEANVLSKKFGSKGYFTMEYVAGGTLREYMRTRTFLPFSEAILLAKQICSGIMVAHRSSPPIVHRDLKPENILVGYYEEGLLAKVADFGLAKQVDRFSFLASAAGTLTYKPPEAFEGVDSPAGDVFAIGIILYEMLTGQLPFATGGKNMPLNRNNLKKMLVDYRKKQPPAASTINLALDETLDEIIFKAIAFDNADRYDDAGKMEKALVKYEKSLKPEQIASADAIASTLTIKPKKKTYPVETKANEYLKQAFKCAKQASTLDEAVDYLQKAMTLDASLRDRYGKLLTLWKKGIIM